MDAQSDKELKIMAAQQHRAMLQAKKKLVLSDFWEFSREVVGWGDLYPPLHGSLTSFMQDNRDKKRLILLPRGHLKSSVITVGYSLWKIAQDPKVRILIANGTYDMAVTFLSQIKDHLRRNEKFIELFGDLTTEADKWSENMITVKREESYERKEPTITAFGIGGNLVSQHYDVIIFDDVVNRDNVHTGDRILDVQMFYKDAMDLLDNPDKSEVVVVGTRWHEADLYGWILDQDNPASTEYVSMLRTAVEGNFELTKNSATGRYKIDGGDLIFPTKFTRGGLEKLLNDKGPSEFSAQYLNDPVPSDQALFRHEFKYYEDSDLKGQNLNTFVLCDPAFYDPSSKSVDLDYAVFLVLQVNQNNDWFIRDILRDRMQPKEIIDMMFELDKTWKPRTTGIETTAYQKILTYTAREMMRERNQFIPITEVRHAGARAKSKAERIQALEPRYAVGSIYHSKNLRHLATLEMELRRFPRGKTDDVIDALASALEVAYPPKKYEKRGESTNKFLGYPA